MVFLLECTFTFTEMKGFYKNVLASPRMLLQAFLVYDWKFHPERRGSHV